jgi:sigma-B regulation protein RsbU (phosphoserine phosphatase)
VAIYVADVSGHGVAASLLSVAISRMLTPDPSAASLVVKPTGDPARPHIVPPLDVATELNRRFPMQDSGGKYFTLVYGVVDLETREFTYVSAGHPPVVRQSPNQEPEVIRLDGMAIGWTPDADFEQTTITLNQGERLCIYSDGVPEAMDPEFNQFGNTRFMASLVETRAFPLQEGVTSLVSKIERWCGDGGPKDDVSVVAFEIIG